MSLEAKLDFIRRGMNVRRYHQYHTTNLDTVGKHSAGVALFIGLIYGDKVPRAELLMAALVHDLPEVVIGDIPSPAKKAMSADARMDLSIVEDKLLEQHCLDFSLTEEEQYFLKVADCFDGMMFCIEELNRGNRELIEVGEKYRSYLGDLVVGRGNPRLISILNLLDKKWVKVIA